MIHMKTLLLKTLLLYIWSVGWSLPGSGQGITFFQEGLEAAKTKAAAEQKLIFIDFYADWCGPCKMMEKEVFTDSLVGAYYNSKFISLQINVEKKENQKWVKQYKVTSMPTLAVIRPDGKIVSLVTGARSKEEFLKMGQVAAGDAMSFEELYAQCKSSNNDPRVVRQTLKEARAYVGGLEGIEAQKWISRVNKLYKDYIAEQLKSDTALINPEDYQISLVFHQIKKDDPLLEYINSHMEEYIQKMGNAPAAWVIEYNNQICEELAKAGDSGYREYLDRISGDMRTAYSTAPEDINSIYNRQKGYCDGLYILYHKKDAGKYIEHMNHYLKNLGDKVDATTYGQAAQNMYYAMSGKLTSDQHKAAAEWIVKALQFPNIPLIDRINYLAMLGDSHKAMKDYKKAAEAYNQAYMESLQIEGKMTAMEIQMAIKSKLAALELLQ